MNNLKSILRYALDPLIAASVFTSIMIVVLAIWGKKASLSASEWSGWVQAVGSISAILISLGLTNYQINRQRQSDAAKQRDEVRRICLAFRDELQMLRRLIFDGHNTQALLALEPGETFDVLLPNIDPRGRFPIYNSTIGRLTLIDNDQLRQAIIEVYETAIGLAQSALENNRMLLDRRELNAFGNPAQYSSHFDQMRKQAVEMQNLLNDTISRLALILPALDYASGHMWDVS